jgi:hypothetical protein
VKNPEMGAFQVPVILNEVKDLSSVSRYDRRLPGDCCGRSSFALLRMTVLFHAALVPGMLAQDDGPFGMTTCSLVHNVPSEHSTRAWRT